MYISPALRLDNSHYPFASVTARCAYLALSYMVGSQWADVWLFMIESPWANSCYHFCKPYANNPHKRWKRWTNIWIIWSQKQAQCEIPSESGLQQLRIKISEYAVLSLNFHIQTFVVINLQASHQIFTSLSKVTLILAWIVKYEKHSLYLFKIMQKHFSSFN